MLMGVAEVLAGMRNDLPGTVKFIFQPRRKAHRGERAARADDRGSALDDPKPSAIFGSMCSRIRREIRYRPAHHGKRGRFPHRRAWPPDPWRAALGGIDPVVVASQIVLGLQTIASRQIDVTAAPAIVTVGAINGGVRFNIIPDSVVMLGTIRTFDTAVRNDIHARCAVRRNRSRKAPAQPRRSSSTPRQRDLQRSGMTEKFFPPCAKLRVRATSRLRR